MSDAPDDLITTDEAGATLGVGPALVIERMNA